MVDILHRVGVISSVDEVYTALTTIDGLAGWWASNTAGNADEGGVIEFRFGPGGFDMKVTELDPGKKVVWEVVDGPEEWIGTEISWELKQSDDFAIILFAHRGWREEVEFMYHCSTKWATFLMSLKSLIETGSGAPDPRDVKISDWH
ncbi:SRPBCC family protein [Antrihabitans cavernicola]|uniref:SRPBCC domain-containing protein n=1 Tax=Antrihabitans cavernicola TaxID=2495913 RepID=A0A5A7S9C6_9NOCA|nr:SRPBCC domain-containing protein [Spelaeibacter cavernicola]KAA0021752.1 SRPBCC domain-containing protein [Spelaeibacter cavernicola]